MKNKIASTVDFITKRYGTADPKLLCEALGIKILGADLGGSVNGFFLSLSGRKAIVIDSELKDEHQAYCIAHELGHAILHENLNFTFLSSSTLFPIGKYEREADLFATYLILGNPSQDGLYDQNLLTLSQSTCIPISAVREWALASA